MESAQSAREAHNPLAARILYTYILLGVLPLEDELEGAIRFEMESGLASDALALGAALGVPMSSHLMPHRSKQCDFVWDDGHACELKLNAQENWGIDNLPQSGYYGATHVLALRETTAVKQFREAGAEILWLWDVTWASPEMRAFAQATADGGTSLDEALALGCQFTNPEILAASVLKRAGRLGYLRERVRGTLARELRVDAQRIIPREFPRVTYYWEAQMASGDLLIGVGNTHRNLDPYIELATHAPATTACAFLTRNLVAESELWSSNPDIATSRSWSLSSSEIAGSLEEIVRTISSAAASIEFEE